MREWVLNLSRTTSIRLRRNKGQSGNSCPGRPGASFFFRKEASVAWIYLIAAGILETLWAVAMKASNGFTLLIPSLITVLAMIGSVALLALAM
ncbi:DMT family transporter, partial [Sutterella wadsworthensis]|uniref:DMT family transporter n=1 Tax=Sutterella wadsworthensis TaxID=40545 RepID=UPI003F587CDB